MTAKRTSRRQYADRLFRLRIRKRDKECQAKSLGPCDGPLEVAHFFGRRALSVRWSELNACLLCRSHHRHLDLHPDEMWQFVRERLTPEEFEVLKAQHNELFHKDYDLVIAGLK